MNQEKTKEANFVILVVVGVLLAVMLLATSAIFDAKQRDAMDLATDELFISMDATLEKCAKMCDVLNAEGSYSWKHGSRTQGDKWAEVNCECKTED